MSLPLTDSRIPPIWGLSAAAGPRGNRDPPRISGTEISLERGENDGENDGDIDDDSAENF